ncbi:MAG TPA: glycosyl hydrolase family 5, partial [Candidatus Dormibacteraeota bacterium]|nr:glycosyl hydrolase family 5 [Candidatus Dormibacteraeota bacterium]
QRTSQYYAAQLMTREWALPGDAEHRLFRATADVQDAAGHVLVTAYALLRPDGQWALLLVNKDFASPHPVRVAFVDDGAPTAARAFRGDTTMISYGKAQYEWHPAMKNGYADPDDPPVSRSIQADAGTVYELPPASVTVLRGRL